MNRGSSLLDSVIGSALFLVIIVGILGVMQLSVRETIDSKARAGALMLATEQVEFLQSLPYDDVGVGDKNKGHGNDDDGVDDDNPGGGGGGGGNDPDELLDQTTTITLNDIAYSRRTYVYYTDDAADGVANQDDDNERDDYKHVKVQVSWESRGVTRSVSLTTIAVPPSNADL